MLYQRFIPSTLAFLTLITLLGPASGESHAQDEKTGAQPQNSKEDKTDAPKKDNSNQSADEIFIMNPFEVVGEEGYQSTQTASASVFAEEIGRTPVQIDVLTRDFMDDIGAADVNEALQYATNVKPGLDASAGSAQNYTIRGLQSDRPTRNFIQVSYPADRYNIERAEVLQGPAALQYGRPDPGGLVNLTSKVPVFMDNVEIETRLGSYENFRSTFDLNTYHKNENLAVRVNGVYEDREGWRLHEESLKKAVTAHLLYRFSPNTNLRLETEIGSSEANPSRSVLIYNNKFLSDKSVAITGGILDIPFKYAQSHSGPDSYVNYDWYNVELTLQNVTWDDNLATQIKLVKTFVDRDVLGLVNSQYLRDDGRIQGFWNGQSWNPDDVYLRADSAYTWENNFMRLRLLGGFRLDDSKTEIQQTRDFANINNPIVGARTAPNWQFFNYRDIINGSSPEFSTTTRDFIQWETDRRRFTIYGGYFGFSGEFLNKRLNVQGGIRYDHNDVKFYKMDSFIDSRDRDSSAVKDGKATSALGFVYQLFPGVGFFANYGESYNMNLRLGLDNEYLPPRETAGIDLGFKFKVFQDKISGSIYAFKIENQNIWELVPNALLPSGSQPGAAVTTDQKSQGAGIDLVARPFAGLSIRGGYGYMDVVRERGYRQYGLPAEQTVQGTAAHNFNLFANYAFQNKKLRGLSTGLGVNYRSSAVAGYLDSNGDNIPDQEYSVAGYTQLNGLLSYSKKFKDFRWLISLNVQNLFNAEYINPINLVTATRSNPRTILITSRFTF